jgi:hypothetical protein
MRAKILRENSFSPRHSGSLLVAALPRDESSRKNIPTFAIALKPILTEPNS